MAMNDAYAATEPARADVDAMTGPVLLEFGAPWCSHCRAAQPALAAAMANHADVRHIKIEDGRGRPLGRSFGVRLWPTLIFMKQGQEATRLVRPTQQAPIAEALVLIT